MKPHNDVIFKDSFQPYKNLGGKLKAFHASCLTAAYLNKGFLSRSSYTRFFDGFGSFEPQPQGDKQTRVIWGSLGTWAGLWAKTSKN